MLVLSFRSMFLVLIMMNLNEIYCQNVIDVFSYLRWDHVCIKGCIYWRVLDYSNVIVSFDFKSEMFRKVCLPDGLFLTRE